jgi:hypothetical protein
VPDERLKAEPNRFCVGAGTARNLGMSKQFIVDVQRLLHASDTTIPRWHINPYRVNAAHKAVATAEAAEISSELRGLAGLPAPVYYRCTVHGFAAERQAVRQTNHGTDKLSQVEP